MKTRLKRWEKNAAKCRVAGVVLVGVAIGLAALSLNLMTCPERLAPLAAAFAGAGALCLSMGAAICFHAAGDEGWRRKSEN
jgi:hypothetical protein